MCVCVLQAWCAPQKWIEDEWPNKSPPIWCDKERGVDQKTDVQVFHFMRLMRHQKLFSLRSAKWSESYAWHGIHNRNDSTNTSHMHRYIVVEVYDCKTWNNVKSVRDGFYFVLFWLFFRQNFMCFSLISFSFPSFFDSSDRLDLSASQWLMCVTCTTLKKWTRIDQQFGRHIIGIDFRIRMVSWCCGCWTGNWLRLDGT